MIQILRERHYAGTKDRVVVARKAGRGPPRLLGDQSIRARAADIFPVRKRLGGSAKGKTGFGNLVWGRKKISVSLGSGGGE